MRTPTFMIMAAFALIAAGCGNDENEMTTTDDLNGEIRLSSGIDVQTRTEADAAQSRQIAAAQAVGVFITDAVAADGTPVGGNLQYTADGSGGLTLAGTTPPQPVPCYPNVADSKVSICAYQPYDALAATDGGYTFSVAADQNASAKAYYDSDLLYSASTAYARSKDAHTLTFTHMLSKVVCTLTAGAGAPSVDAATVEIVKPVISGTFAPSAGTFTTSTTVPGEDAKVVMNNSVVAGTYIAVVPPQEFVAGANFLKITLKKRDGNADALVDAGTFYYKYKKAEAAGGEAVAARLSLDAHKVYTFKVKVNLTGVEVTSEITDWIPGAGDADGEADMG